MSIKKGIYYVFIANLINVCISLISNFLLPKYLSIETYGQIKLFNLYVSYIGIMHLGYSDGMQLKHGGKDLENINKLEVLEEFKTFRIFQMVVVFIAILISVFLKNQMLLLISFTILPVNISNYVRNLYTAIGQFKRYSRYTNINTLFIFIINIILLFIIKTDAYYIYIYAYIFCYILYAIFIYIELGKIFGNTKVKADKKYMISNIKPGFMLLLGNYCNVIFTTIDKIFIKNFIGLVQFAYYSFATSIEGLTNLFISPISTVMYNYFCKVKGKEHIIKVKKYILIFSAVIIAMVFPVKFIIDMWINKYSESIKVIFIIFAAQYISIMVRSVHINLYKAEKRQNHYFKIMISVVILSIILDIIAYKISKSIISVAYATLIVNIVWFIIGEIELRNYKFSIKDYFFEFLIMALFVICGLLMDALIGLVTYSLCVFVFIMIFEKSTFFELLKEGKALIASRLRIK